jgi:hypothetical protein
MRTKRHKPGHRRTNILAIVAAVMVAAGGAAAGIVLGHPFGNHLALAATRSKPPVKHSNSPSPPPSPTPSATPQATASPVTAQQATTSLATLLAQSGTDRQAVSTAYNDVLNCGSDLQQDYQAFTSAAASHQRLLGELTQLPGLSTLPPAMVTDLKTAWQASISADTDFAKWTQDEISSACSTSSQSDPNFNAATQPDLQATASKTAFVAIWNPMAQTYGLPTYTQSTI